MEHIVHLEVAASESRTGYPILFTFEEVAA